MMPFRYDSLARVAANTCKYCRATIPVERPRNAVCCGSEKCKTEQSRRKRECAKRRMK